MDCPPKFFKGTKGQQFRDWTRKKLSGNPIWRVLVALFFTILHDVAGLFSASPTIMARIHWFPQPWQNLALIYCTIVLFDCVSEIMLVYYHDIPLCHRKEFNWTMIHIALGGQIITGFLWLGLMCLVAYSALFTVCPLDQNFARCQALIPGLTEALVVFMVFIKNAMLLKEYKERVEVYPIICSEELLYLHHFMFNDPEKIMKDFQKFHSLDDDVMDLEKIGCTSRTPFNIVLNYCMLILFDVAAIASVTSLIIEPGDEKHETFLKALPFLLIVFFDIFSESLILKYHDLPLCNQDEDKLYDPRSKKIFFIARAIQVLCFLAWLGALIYMIFSVTSISCHELCVCSVPDTGVSCDSPICKQNGYDCEGGSCGFLERGYCNLISNDTIMWEKPIRGQNFTYLSNCTVHVSLADCINSSPTWTSCILLGLVLIDSIFQIMQMFFRSYIYPITIPEYVLFLSYWERGALKKMIEKVGKNEFGVDWDPKHLADTLIEYEDTLVELELGASLSDLKLDQIKRHASLVNNN